MESSERLAVLASLEGRRTEVDERPGDVDRVTELAQEPEALLEQLRRGTPFTGDQSDVPTVVQCKRMHATIGQIARTRDRLVQHGSGALELARRDEDRAEVAQRPSLSFRVPALLVQRQALLGETAGARVVALEDCQRGGDAARLRAQRRELLLTAREGALERHPPLRQVAAHVAEAAERRGQTELESRLAGVGQPGERRAGIVVLPLQMLERRRLPGSAELALGTLRQLGEEHRVLSGDRLGLGCGNEAASVLPHGLEHREAGRGRRRVALQQALVDQRREAIELGAADRLGRLERGATREDGERRKVAALQRAQEIRAPLEGRAKRLLPSRQVSRPDPQHRESSLQTLAEARRRQHPGARGGELDGEREPVEVAAHGP